MRVYIADIITLFRIIGSIVLIDIEPFSYPFLVVYSLCGISDALDGFVARKLNIASETGAKLDSVSDLTFYSVMFYKIWPTLETVLPEYTFYIIWTIFGIRLACYVYVFVRDRKLASEHFILNKITGLLLFTIPYVIKCAWFEYYALVICLVALIAAIKEFKFHLLRK